MSANQNTNIPPVSEIDTMEFTQEEQVARETLRNTYIEKCRDYVNAYIQKKAPGKIKYRAKVHQKTNCYIFRFSAPKPRGVKTRYFSQVVLNVEKNECYFDYQRPQNHPQEVWYFPIYYMINGFTKNPKRTFQAIGLEPVFNSLRSLFEGKGYQIKFIRNRFYNENPTGNLILVEWGASETVEDVSQEWRTINRLN